MRPIWKTVLRLAADAAATIGFFYFAVKPAALTAGATVASAISVLSFFSGTVPPADASFLGTMMLAAWMAVYMVLVFAIAMEVVRRLIGNESLLPYLLAAALGVPIALALTGYVGPLRHGAEGFEFTARDAVAVSVLILAGTAGGTVYWLITVKLRSLLTLLLRRLLCGAEPRAASCAFS